MKKIVINQEQSGKRIDKFLASSFVTAYAKASTVKKASADKGEFFLSRKNASLDKYSRGEIIKKINNGEVLINGKNVKPRHILATGDIIELENFSKESAEEELSANAEISLDVIFENENIVVINKQAGIQVHPSHNEKINTIANAIIARYPEISQVHDDSAGAKFRPGIVHRLDKDTSGVMVIARNKTAFVELKKLFAERSVEKKYIAICEGIFDDKEGIIEKSIARSSGYRKQIIARKNTKTKIREAVTKYKIIKEYGNYSMVEAMPKTGRMHQIRIHLASIGHPIVGDLVYHKKIQKQTEKKQENVKRQLLHAKELKFELFGEKYDFSAPIPSDFAAFLVSID